MTRLHYVGFNGYHQCPKNEKHIHKIIADWSAIDTEKILSVSCAHRLMVVETTEVLKIYGVVTEDSQEWINFINKPAADIKLATNDNYLIAAEKTNIWRYSYKKSEWMKVIVSFMNKEEEAIWEESGNNILKISFQQNHLQVILLLSNGSIWKLLEKDKLELLYPYDVDKAVDVSSGLEHSLILTESGCVLSLGNGSRGQLGHGDLNSTPEPVQISALEGLMVTKIAAGGWHSCAVTDSGDLCTWGWNNFGQLSAFENDEEISLSALPVFVDVGNDPDLRVVDVACGRRHTVAVLENGELFSTGWNSYSQLGVGATSEKVSKFAKTNIKISQNGKLICGPWYTILLEEKSTK